MEGSRMLISDRIQFMFVNLRNWSQELEKIYETGYLGLDSESRITRHFYFESDMGDIYTNLSMSPRREDGNRQFMSSDFC